MSERIVLEKDYIEREYRAAVLDFRTAKNEDEQWSARRNMARLEALAAEMHGFDYADSLKELLTNK